MKNFIIFILGCFAALLFGELAGEKFGVFGITNRYAERNSPSRKQRVNYARYYSNFYDGWHEGFMAGARSERNHAKEEALYEEEDEV